MENAKFRVAMVKDENGNLVRKFVPCDDGQSEPAVYSVYGDYLKTDKDHIQEAKTALLENLFDVLRDLSEQDDFWIVKALDEDTITVGWKIHIPQMDKQ